MRPPVPRALRERRGGARADRCAPTRPRTRRPRTTIPAERVRDLARDFAAADGAAAYGRTGSCLGRHGTLVAFLLDALNAVTGNLDRPGGAVFGRPPVALDDVGERVGPRDLRRAALARGRLPRRDRQHAGVAAAARDRDTGRGADPGALRLGRQPGAVGARRRGAGARAGAPRPVRVDRPVRERDEPARRLRAAGHHLLRARGPAARVPRLLQHAVHPVQRRGRSAAGRVPPGVGGRRGPLAAARPRALQREAAAQARAARPEAAARAARGPAAAHRAQRRPVRPAPRRAQPEAAARASARPGARRRDRHRRARGQAAHPGPSRAARAARDRGRGRAARRLERR